MSDLSDAVATARKFIQEMDKPQTNNLVVANVGWPRMRDMCEYLISLDPKPPTLREQVAAAWCAEWYGETSESAKNPAPDQLDAADAVLAVVADWLVAQPLAPEDRSVPSYRRHQRDHDVRLLRGQHG